MSVTATGFSSPDKDSQVVVIQASMYSSSVSAPLLLLVIFTAAWPSGFLPAPHSKRNEKRTGMDCS